MYPIVQPDTSVRTPSAVPRTPVGRLAGLTCFGLVRTRRDAAAGKGGTDVAFRVLIDTSIAMNAHRRARERENNMYIGGGLLVVILLIIILILIF